jgi:DeoR family transcriptional regulator, fructose operon transcriptional repressor
MLAAERHSRIADALRLTRTVSTDELAHDLKVSVETIRRDFVELERRGQLRRVHGGATAAGEPRMEEASFTERRAMAFDAKVAIGRAAAELVKPGQTLVIDIGTTAEEVAKALPGDFHGTVATCSLRVATELAGRPDVTVLMSGGRVRGGDLACSNAQTVAFFSDIRADIAFLGSGGFDAVAGLTDYYIDEVATRRVIIANAAQAYVLADSTKIGRVAPHRVCELDALDGLITETSPADSLTFAVQRARGVVITA